MPAITADLPALARSIKEWGRELGFQQVAIAGLDLGEHEHHLERWLAAGYHGDMDYMAAHGSKRSHPEELVPGTLRVVSLRMDYLPGDTHMAHWLAQPEKAYVSRYALGRDYLTRLLYGGRVSLLVGFLSMLISIVFGTVYGIVSGSSGKLVDGFMMRIVDILMSVPSFLIIITLNIYMNAGIRTLVVTIGLFSWMGVARIVRAEVLSLRERDFILASEGLGARKSWVITRHFARNVFSPVLVASTNSIASAILTESSLSYLGFGISIPNPSWGGMLEGAQTYILTHPSLAVYPGVCILLTVLCFNVLGNGFRRRFSPNSGR